MHGKALASRTPWTQVRGGPSQLLALDGVPRACLSPLPPPHQPASGYPVCTCGHRGAEPLKLCCRQFPATASGPRDQLHYPHPSPLSLDNPPLCCLMSGSDPLEEQGCEPARRGWLDWGSREEWGGGTQWRALHGFKRGSKFEERLIAQPDWSKGRAKEFSC